MNFIKVIHKKAIQHHLLYRFIWGERRGLNPRHPEPQSGALPTELRPPLYTLFITQGEDYKNNCFFSFLQDFSFCTPIQHKTLCIEVGAE